MSYQATSNKNIFKITVKLYRDCSAEALCTGCEIPFPNGTTNGCNLNNAGFTTAIIAVDKGFEGINYGAFNLNIVTGIANGYDIVEFQNCEKNKSICTNCNTRRPGTFSVGVEVYIFEGLVDLSSVTFKKAIQTLKKDKVFSEIILLCTDKVQSRFDALGTNSDLYISLLRSIVSQQLSTKVTSTIYGRFLDLFPNKYPKANAILKTKDEQLRAAGLSFQK